MGLIPKLDKRLAQTSKLAARRANAILRKHAEMMPGPEPEDEFPEEARRTQSFDLDRLFADL
jgi:hypothetical protein